MKKYDVYLMPDAIKDLEGIYGYITDKSDFPEKAWAYIEKLRRKCHESCTTGRAGGLNSEPLKAVENLGPPKGAGLFK